MVVHGTHRGKFLRPKFTSFYNLKTEHEHPFSNRPMARRQDFGALLAAICRHALARSTVDSGSQSMRTLTPKAFADEGTIRGQLVCGWGD